MTRLSRLLVLLMLIFLPSWVHAHEVRPGYLELRESESGVFSTTWKVPARGDYRLAIQPSYPQFCRQIGEPMTAQADSAFIERGRIRCDKPLAGSRILIRGLEATQTDVLARIEGADGAVETERLTPSQPDFIVPAKPSRLGILWTYFQLGVEHILTGVDHLLFVLCLVLLVRDVRMLLATVTAFTVAHSITLAAATLGFVNVRSAPVEATIALSIVFLASELLRDPAQRSDITQILSMVGCVQLWTLARPRFRRRPCRSGASPRRNSARLIFLQCRSRVRAVGLYRNRSFCDLPLAACGPAHPGVGTSRRCLRHRLHRFVLGLRASGCGLTM